MNSKIRVISLILLSVFLICISGCNAKSEVDEIQKEKTLLTEKIDELTENYKELQNTFNTLNTEYKKLQDTNTSLSSANNKVKTELADIQTKLDAAQTEITSLQSALAVYQDTQTSLTNLQSKYDSLQNDYQAISAELTRLQNIPPPRNFTSLEELTDWLKADDTSENDSDDPIVVYGQALELQRRAREDGYIVNVNVGYDQAGTTFFYRIYCTALTQDNTLYSWDIRTDGPDILIRNVKDFRWATTY